MSYSVAEKFARTFSRSHGGRYVAGEVRETVKSGDRARAKRSVRTRRSLDYGELRRE